MITFSHPLALLLLLPLLALSVLIWRSGYVNLSRRRSRIALGVRVVMLLAIVLGLAGMGLSLAQSRQATVMVADLSASDAQARGAMQQAIARAATERPADDRLGVVTFGRTARVEQPPAPLTDFGGFQSPVDPNFSNIDDGLSLAGAILPDGFRRRVVVMTDGQQNLGDALSTARLLHSIGTRVDVYPIHVSRGPEVEIDGVAVPSELRTHERFSMVTSIRSNVDTTGLLTIFRDRTLVFSQQERIRAGENRYVFAQTPLDAGFHSFQVQITPVLDTQPENNTGSAFTVVGGPPRVLVISPSAHEAANVLASLRTTGIEADFQTPGNVIATLSALQRYAAVVLVDTPATALNPDLPNTLVPYVRDLGHGLVVIGGRESYGVGGYSKTGLEKALPVQMDLPKRKDLPSAAVVLIIESLESDSQVDISRQAGKGVLNLLTPADQIAVNDAQGNSSFAVPLQHVTNRTSLDAAIDQMQPGDPPSYAPDLQAAYNALKKTVARVKHIIILGDGDAEDPGYQQLATRIRAAGVTISTVATNGLGFSNFKTMRDLAKWGGGRYYRADDSSAIPTIFLREARTVVRSGFVEGKFYPQEISPSPILRDIRSVPNLTGYVATTPKPAGEVILASKQLDPVLATWQFGLGRSVAWTSDAAGLWTRDWLQAPGANRFWANLVSWTLPTTQGGNLFINAGSSQGQGRISIDTPPSLGASPSVTAHVLGPDLQSTIQLQPVAPGHFTGTFPASAPGAYFVTADARGVDHSAAGQTGLDVPYSAEYQTTGINPPFIRALADAGGGSVISGAGAVWQDSLSPVYAFTSLQIWLWLLALLLLPIDIGVRRLVVTREDLTAIRRALAGVHRAPLEPAPVLVPLEGLRQARQKRRSTAARPPVSPALRVSAPAATRAPQTSIPVTSPQVRTEPPAGAQPVPAATTSQLLASKRRRKG